MPTPTNNFGFDGTHGCAGSAVAFNEPAEVEGQTYFWNFGDGGFATIRNPYHVFRDPGVYSVSLTVTNQYGCENTVVRNNLIEIFPVPSASFIAEPEEASITNPLISFTNFSEGASYYFWYYGDGDSTIYITHPQHFYEATGEFEVKLIAKNIHGCADTVWRTVYVVGEVTLYAPEAFTPNGDGVNDCFRLCGSMIDPYSFRIQIYDRWGQRVFETNRYVPDAACNSCAADSWDGTRGSRYEGDPYLPNAMYYWYAEFKDIIGIKHEASGMVRLIR